MSLQSFRESTVLLTNLIGPKRRGQTAKAQSAEGLAEVARATNRLWGKRHLSYDQTKYVVEQARRARHGAGSTNLLHRHGYTEVVMATAALLGFELAQIGFGLRQN